MSRHVDRLTRELNEAREKLRTTAATSNSSEDSDTETEKATEPKPSRQSGTTFGGQIPMEVDDNVSEEMVERMEEKLELAQADQKNLFLIVFQVLYFNLNHIQQKMKHQNNNIVFWCFRDL